MGLDLQDLTVFVAVARQGSFGRAASELMVSQPAVSERIRHLERSLGRAVFERSARGARLTTAGEELLPYADRCLAVADEAVEAVRRVEGVPRLVLAVHSTFAARIVPFVLHALTNLPRRFAVRDVHSEMVGPLVRDGAADVGVALTGSVARGLTRVALRPDPVVCVTTKAHALAGVARPSFAALRDTLIAVNRWGDGVESFFDRLREVGVEDWRIRECGDAATAVRLARDSDHVAFVARSSVEHEPGLTRIPFPGNRAWTVRLELVHRAADRDDPAIRALIGAAPTA